MPNIIATDTALYIRPAGSPEWIKINPNTQRGQRLLAHFRITPEGEFTMSTGRKVDPDEVVTEQIRTVYDNVDGSTTIHDQNVTRMGEAVESKGAIRRAWDAVWALPKKAWAWAKRTFHLEAAGDKVRAGYGHASRWMRNFVEYMGTSGMLGIGLTTIATSVGRSVLKFLFTPIAWALGKIGSAWVWLENKLFDDTPGHETSLRNKFANGMANVREFFEDKALWVADKWVRYLAPIFAIDSLAMRGTKILGLLLLLPKALGALAFLPIAGIWLTLAQVALGIALSLEIIDEGLTVISTLQRKPEVGEAAKESVSDAAKVAATEVVRPGPGANRAARRAADRVNKGGAASAAKAAPAR